jgi:hypothetical protein
VTTHGKNADVGWKFGSSSVRLGSSRLASQNEPEPSFVFVIRQNCEPSRTNNVKYTIILYYYYVLNYFIEFLELDT